MNARKLFVLLLLVGLLVTPGATSAGEIVGVGRNASPWWSVLSWYSDPFGLVEGKTDATPLFSAVFTAADGLDDFSFIIPPGTYSIDPGDTLTLPAGSTLRGSGMGVTILKMEAGRTGRCLTLGSNCTLQDLTIQGNDEATTTGVLPASDATNIRVERVEFLDCNTGAGSNGVNEKLAFIGCRFRSNVTYGLQTAAAVSATTVLDCEFDSNGTDLALQGSPVGGLIAGNRFKDSTTHISNTSGIGFTIVANSFIGGTTNVAWGGSRNEFGENYDDGGTIDGPATVVNTPNTYKGKYYYSAEPAAGVWQRGDIVWDSNPGASNAAVLAWYCTTAGTAGSGAVFQKVYRGQPLIVGSGTWDPASMADGAVTSKSDFNVPGAVLGNRVTVAAPYAVDAGVLAYASVVSADTVRVTLFNHSGSPVDFASGTWTIQVSQ